MVEVTVAEARARLCHYLRLAESGKRVVILRRGAPVAAIVAYRPPVDGTFALPLSECSPSP